MKHLPLIPIALAVLCTTPAVAQTWCAPGATWVYQTTGDPEVSSGGGTRYRYEGDTLVDGYTAQRISVFSYGVIHPPWEDTTIVYTTWGDDEVTRAEPGIVYLWLRDLAEWDTLYWFGAEYGDRWTPGWHQYSEDCESNGYLEVVYVETNWDTGIPMRELTLAQYSNGEEQSQFIVKEWIGNTVGCWIPWPPGWCGEFSETGCQFSCYTDQWLYATPWPSYYETCVLSITGMEQQPPGSAATWSVFPVPFHERFTVRSASSPTTHMVLLDLSGRELLRKTFNGSILQVEAGHLVPGSYVLRMTDGHGNQMHRAVIKQ